MKTKTIGNGYNKTNNSLKMMHNMQQVTLYMVLAIILFALFSIQYGIQTESYRDRILAAEPPSDSYALNEIEMQERVGILYDFFLQQFRSNKIEEQSPLDENSIRDATTEFVNNMWREELTLAHVNRKDILTTHNQLNIFLLMMGGKHIVNERDGQMKRFRFQGSQIYSHPNLEYIVLDPHLLERWFFQDFQLFRITWCDWRYKLPISKEQVLKRSIYHDAVSEHKHARGHFHVDQPRALPEVHYKYSNHNVRKKRYEIKQNEKVVDPNVKENPYDPETYEYSDHNRYHKFHEFFRPQIPTDVDSNKESYPIGYMEIFSHKDAERFLDVEYDRDDRIRIKNDKFRVLFDYANGIFYLSNHYERWKVTYTNEEKLHLNGIGQKSHQNTENEFAQNPYFLLELQFTTEQCQDVWSD